MKIKPTPIEGVFCVEPTIIGDNRGFFTRALCVNTFAEHGIEFKPVQANHAASAQAGTLRGLHYQKGEAAEVKLMRCIRGRVFDVAVDIRPGSPTYLKWYGCELSSANKKMLIIPKGCAHGYQTLEDDSEMYYMVSAFYTPSAEWGLRWDDPKIAIDWPIKDGLTISDKDQNWPLL